MEGQAAPGAGGGDESLSFGRMNPKRSGRAAEEENRNKLKLVSELWGWERSRARPGDEEGGGGGGADAVLLRNVGRRGVRPGPAGGLRLGL